MKGTPYWYGGAPQAILAATPTAAGIEVSITYPTEKVDFGARLVLSIAEFRKLLADGPALIADTEREQAKASHAQHDLFETESEENR